MKKSKFRIRKQALCLVLAFVMMAGLLLPVSAAQTEEHVIDPTDPSTWGDAFTPWDQIDHPEPTGRNPETDPLAVIYSSGLGFIRPGDLLASGASGGSYVKFGVGNWSEAYEQFFYTAGANIHVSHNLSYTQRDIKAQLILVGDVELIEAMVVFEDGTRFYPVRDFYADGEVVTINIVNPPANQAREIFFSFRIIRGTDGATASVLFNDQDGSISNIPAWVANLSPYERTRPIGTGYLADYHMINNVGSRVPRIGVVFPTLRSEAPNLNTASNWAHDNINEAFRLGLIPQNLQSNYTANTTRAEFAALAVALYETVTGTEITGRMQFSDTSDINVQKMGYLGVVTGVGGGNFAPNNTLTREQAAVMLARLAYAIGQPLPPSAPTFADNNQISSWAVDGVGQMQASGIMGGVGNNQFSPLGNYTREQSIVTMMRLFDLLD